MSGLWIVSSIDDELHIRQLWNQFHQEMFYALTSAKLLTSDKATKNIDYLYPIENIKFNPLW